MNSGPVSVPQSAGILAFHLGKDIPLEAGVYYTVMFTWTDAGSSDKQFSVRYGTDADGISGSSWDASNSGSWVRRQQRNYLFYAAPMRESKEFAKQSY